jgi:glutathione S-transferase
MSGPLRLWASELSPFALKLRACLKYAELPYRSLPEEGTRLEALRFQARIAWSKRRHTVVRHPKSQPLDEYPLVPFLEDDEGRIHYDSSGLARWLDEHHLPKPGPLFPEAPELRFLGQLLDEAFDEFGLYMVHHNRWVPSAETTRAGLRLAQEFTPLLSAPLAALLIRRFARRQTRRLPYLFSVAPAGLRPGPAGPFPAPAGFPSTHALLEQAWESTLAAMEAVLAAQPYLLGERFTVADASAYGQLSMNLLDGRSADRLRELAPTTFSWLCAIREGEHVRSRGRLRAAPELGSLLDVIGGTFVPLMQQNEAAFLKARAAGEILFNERAFDAGRALFDGELLGHPFRAVVKTFQVQVWRELRASFAELPRAQRPALPAGIERALSAQEPQPGHKGE